MDMILINSLHKIRMHLNKLIIHIEIFYNNF